MTVPPYGSPSAPPPYGQPQQPPPYGQPHQQALRCPRCEGMMRTYNRNGVQIEQCDACRGIFLDFGELEALMRLESQFVQQAPPQYQAGYGHGPAWGHHGGKQYHRGGFGRLFFSS